MSSALSAPHMTAAVGFFSAILALLELTFEQPAVQAFASSMVAELDEYVLLPETFVAFLVGSELLSSASLTGGVALNCWFSSLSCSSFQALKKGARCLW